MWTRALAVASALGLASVQGAGAQERLNLTIATGHPEVLLWVKHLKETFIPTLDAELAKTGEVEITWTEAYGGTLVKLGSEVESFQIGLIDVGFMSGGFNPDELGLMNVSYAMPFGPTDAELVTRAAEAALMSDQEILNDLADQSGAVYIGGGLGVSPYNIGATKAFETLSDMEGTKIGGAGPNLSWLAGTGAIGVQASANTFYNEIQTGVYDGYIAWIALAAALKLNEVAPYWNQVGLGATYGGGIGVAQDRWDSFSDGTKEAFRTAAAAYSEAYFQELRSREGAMTQQFLDAGGQIVTLPQADRAQWIADLPNPASPWLEAANARGEDGLTVLRAYQDALAEAGFTFEHDYLAE